MGWTNLKQQLNLGGIVPILRKTQNQGSHEETLRRLYKQLLSQIWFSRTLSQDRTHTEEKLLETEEEKMKRTEKIKRKKEKDKKTGRGEESEDILERKPEAQQ